MLHPLNAISEETGTVSGAPLANILCLMQLDLSLHVFNIVLQFVFRHIWYFTMSNPFAPRLAIMIVYPTIKPCKLIIIPYILYVLIHCNLETLSTFSF